MVDEEIVSYGHFDPPLPAEDEERMTAMLRYQTQHVMSPEEMEAIKERMLCGDTPKPNMIAINRFFSTSMREVYRKSGVNHRLVDRWENDLGWCISEPTRSQFLAVDRGH